MTTTRLDHENSWFERQLADPKVRLEFDKERASDEFVDQLENVLQTTKMSRAALAGKIGRTRAYVTQSLRRRTNLTIKTMAELAGACGYELHIMLFPRTASGGTVFTAPATPWHVVKARPCAARALQPTLAVNSSAVANVPDRSWRSEPSSNACLQAGG